MHDLEIVNGTASFVAVREPGWHNLGKLYPDSDGITVDQALDDLDVGEIITAPVYAHTGNLSMVEIPGKKATIRRRASGDVPLGVVGDDYSAIGEREAFAFLNSLVDSGEALVQTAGLLAGGRRAFCCLRLPTGVLIGGVDPVDMFLTVATSHDGSLALTGLATPVRTVCQNTLTWAIAAATQQWRVVHSKHAGSKMTADEGRRNLKLTFDYQDAMTAEAEAMIDVEMNKSEFEKIIAHLYEPKGPKVTAFAKTIFEQKMDRLQGLWVAPTQANIAGTAWAAANALLEEIDWFGGVRNVDPADLDGHRFTRSIMDGAQGELGRKKSAAVAAVRAYAGV